MECANKFYTYENRPNNFVRIHKGNCSRCKCGRGQQMEIHNGLNGAWRGPFATYREALTNANHYAILLPRNNTQVFNCAFCNPQG